MFSLCTIKKAVDETKSNAQVIKLGKVSEITLGGPGILPETFRQNRYDFLIGE